METFGFIAMMILFCHSSYPNRVKKLEREMRKIKNGSKGEMKMSKIINELVGKSCKITKLDGVSFVEDTIILEADEEWVKIKKTNKKNIESIEIIRIDDIKKIDQDVE